jgi:O-antigen/teichoic acid export membrane protein/glycosyltransferase involved in cell wall biosynthesis
MSASSNARWLILIQGFKVVVQLVSMTVLTRLLPPSDYGLIAMAFTATNLASLVRDLGTSSAIIQKRELSERTKSTVFWLHMAVGCVLAAGLVALSGVLASGFKQPSLAGILCWLALTFPLGGMSAIHQALLERESRFQTLARIEVVASGASLVVAIFAAWRGAGVYSFVWQSFAMTLLYVVQPWLALQWRPAFIWDRAEIRSLFGYSGNLSAFNLINFIARNADSMIIGRALGPTALGAYSMAYKLMLFPLQNLTFVAGRALFPVLSRHQDSNAELARLYRRAAAMVAAVSTPLMAGLFVLREPLSHVAFGSQWGDVPHIIAWLAPVGAMQAITSTTGSLYMAKGRTNVLFKLGVVSAILAICAFVAGIPGGVVGVASLYCLANVILFVPTTLLACRLIDLPYSKFLKSLAPSLICSTFMVPVVFGVFRQTAHLGDASSLIIASLAGALVYSLGYLLFFRADLTAMLKAALGSRFAPQNEAQAADAARTWLFVDLAEDFGGHEVMLLRWINEVQSRSGVKAVLVCRENTRLAHLAAECCEISPVAAARSGKLGSLWFVMRLVALMGRLRWARRPELAVIAEGCLLAQRHGLYAARLSGLQTVMYVPLLASFASMDFPGAATLESKVRGFYGKLPHAWLTITAAQAEEFRAWSKVRQPIFTLPNTVQPALECAPFRPPQSAQPASGLPMRVLVFGRLDHHQKGLDLLLEHLKLNLQLAADFVIHFAGEGPFREVLLYAKQHHPGLSGLIEVEPWASPLDVYPRFDVLLITSRFEGVPLVMLEAMACGLPVVASDLAGTRAYLHSSCLFPVGRIDKGFEAMAKLRHSRTRAQRLARRNLAAFRAQASGKAFASAVDALTVQLREAIRSH